MKTKWKLSDFWEQTLSCTLGTVIGIILTFGTSAWIEYREKQETERTAAMVLSSATFRSFINKQHGFYLAGMQMGLKVLREKTDDCKRLMGVTEAELQQFGYN